MRRISFKIHPRNQQGCFASVRRLVRRNASWKSAYVATRTTPPPKLDEAAQARLRQRQQGFAPECRTELLQRRVEATFTNHRGSRQRTCRRSINWESSKSLSSYPSVLHLLWIKERRTANP